MVDGSPLPNAGTHDFRPPGSNRDGDGGWVLALETQPVETEPPTVQITSPPDGAVLTGTVAVSANASDDVGVVGVRFHVDGTNLGEEIPLPPYTVSWNTFTVPNGPHTIEAIARDLAGNLGRDSVSVTVDNAIPPPPSDHLALAYAFDETGGGTTRDASGNGNTGTVHGATFGIGRNGNALTFDGTSSYVETPNSGSLDIGGTGLSIAFWVLVTPSNSGIDYVVVGKPWNATSMTSPFYQYGVEYSNGVARTLDFYFGDPSSNLHGPYRMNPTPGVWTHVAYTYDGTTVRGYLDGVERLVQADASSLQRRGNSLRLGVDGAYQQFFKGSLDDLRIYNRALTPAEVQGVMQTPVGGGPAGLGGGPDPLRDRPALSVEAENPSRSGTRISYVLPAETSADLRIFDASGRLVRSIASGRMAAGSHSVVWDGADAAGRVVPSGRYFIRLDACGLERTASVVFIR
jgi:hypothetical protein